MPFFGHAPIILNVVILQTLVVAINTGGSEIASKKTFFLSLTVLNIVSWY